MTFAALGIDTSAVEVTNISRHGLWLLLRDEINSRSPEQVERMERARRLTRNP